jgi:hypothetical protein
MGIGGVFGGTGRRLAWGPATVPSPFLTLPGGGDLGRMK